jgi:superfamily I DNA/RNA helicase/mRNA-degrading endonuclease RelE of RelBE toxin-antitoxin system
MPKIILRPTFSKDLDGLRRSARKQYQKASEILLELQRDMEPSAPRRAESRIPNCVKFELQDGYRLVLQRTESDSSLLALVVGTHDHVDSFLDSQKGFVFSPTTGRVRELRLATAAETSITIAPSEEMAAEAGAVASPLPLFAEFSDEMLLRLRIPQSFFAELRAISDPNSLDCMSILQRLADIESHAADSLLAFATGNVETRRTVIDLASGQAVHLEQFPSTDAVNAIASSEEFVTFSDPTELERILEHGTLEQWQLFLHPDQRALVERSFTGPARLRGISGSGKTVVALHRARRLALEALRRGQRILFTTYDKGLSAAAAYLLDHLCGTERNAIDVTHLHRWCLEYVSFCGIARPRYSPDASRETRGQALASISSTSQQALVSLPRDYIWQEVEFLMGRFLHDDSESYLSTDRSGRGRAITNEQRKAILELYRNYHQRLFDRGFVEPAEFVRMAYRLRQKGNAPQATYSAVVVDEVQDVSELGIRLLHSLVRDVPDGLLLVGDATQRIFTRGYSLKGLGIDIAGRGIILRKNYRNTRQILEAAFPLVSNEWEADIAQSGVPMSDLRPEFSVREGCKPIVVRCKDRNGEGRFVASEVAALLRYKHYSPRDICILARNKQYRELVLRALRDAQIPAYSFQTDAVGEVTSDQQAIRVSSLHGAKGHEFGSVLIVGAVEGIIPQHGARDADSLSAEAAVLYVGMTRARDLLYLSYPEKDESGRPLPKSSFITKMRENLDFVDFRR